MESSHLFDSGRVAELLIREMSSVQYVSRGARFTPELGPLAQVEGNVAQAHTVSETRWEGTDCSPMMCFLAPKRRQAGQDHFHSAPVPFRKRKEEGKNSSPLTAIVGARAACLASMKLQKSELIK